MTEFQSNEEFFTALRGLIEGWCDQRKFNALARILPAYTAFSGLTDSWAELYNALKNTRAIGNGAFSDAEWEKLDDLIRDAERAVYRRTDGGGVE
jgi:hypothetical protein